MDCRGKEEQNQTESKIFFLPPGISISVSYSFWIIKKTTHNRFRALYKIDFCKVVKQMSHDVLKTKQQPREQRQQFIN